MAVVTCIMKVLHLLVTELFQFKGRLGCEDRLELAI